MAKGKKTGGRTKGVPNKATAEVKTLARSYGPGAIRKLAELAGLINEGEGKAQSEQAQVSAINQLLDRGYGKPAQVVQGDEDGGPIVFAQLLGNLTKNVMPDGDSEG